MRFLCYSYYFISVFLCSVMLLCEESFSKRTLRRCPKEDLAARARAPTQASFLLFYVLLVIKNNRVLLYVYLRRYVSLFLFLSLSLSLARARAVRSLSNNLISSLSPSRSALCYVDSLSLVKACAALSLIVYFPSAFMVKISSVTSSISAA